LTDFAQSYVESLRSRIRELEEAIAQTDRSAAPPAAPPSPPASEIVRTSQATTNHRAASPSRNYYSPGRNESIAAWPAGPPSVDQDLSTTQFDVFAPRVNHNVTLDSDQSQNYGSHGPSLSSLQDGERQNSAEADEGCIGIGVMGTPSGSLCSECKGLKGQKSDYSGPSSVVDFDRQIRCWAVSPLSDRYGVSSGEGAVPKICHCDVSQTAAASLLELEFSIPQRTTADTLVENYFERVHSLWPFIHRPTFMHSYSQLWQPHSHKEESIRSAGNSRVFHCSLNAVFALGSRFSPYLDATQRVSTSEVFYCRVIKSLNFQLLERGSLEFVQALLLTAQYLQSTQLWGMCWNLVGLAVRVAQGIGLHLSPSEPARHVNGQSANPLDEEMRRRVWGGCLTLDRYVD